MVSGERFTLRSNEILRGDLTVFGGDVVLEENSRVEGDVTLFGGSADIYGDVTRDLTMVGGSAHLRPSSRVEGKQTMLGGSLTRDEGSVIGGQSAQGSGAPFSGGFPWNWQSQFRDMLDRVNNVFSTIAGAILITLLSVAIVALFPAHVARVVEVAQRQWLAAGSIGLLTFMTVPIALVLLSVTICLIPAAVLLLIAWVLAMLGGWAVVARMLGERLAIGLKLTNWSVPGQTALGAVVLALAGALPVIGWLIGLLAIALGMGALILMFADMRSRPRAIQAPL